MSKNKINISEVRNLTQILDTDTLEGILERFQAFCTFTQLEVNKEAWSSFWKPIAYTDFMSLMGQEIEHNGKRSVVAHPYYFDMDDKVDTMFGPECASLHENSRFGGFSPGIEIPFPVDSDVKIRIALKGKDAHEHVHMSYNELAGFGEGRFIHWSETCVGKSSSPINAYLASLSNNYVSDPLYRRTPDGEPSVCDLIKIGTIVKSNYSDQEYIVAALNKCEYQPQERPKEHIFEEWSLSLIDRKTKKGGFFINELVAVGGRILKLFMANDDEVYILGSTESVPTPIKDEDEDECLSCDPCDSDYKESTHDKKVEKEPFYIKGVQLSLF